MIDTIAIVMIVALGTFFVGLSMSPAATQIDSKPVKA